MTRKWCQTAWHNFFQRLCHVSNFLDLCAGKWKKQWTQVKFLLSCPAAQPVCPSRNRQRVEQPKSKSTQLSYPRRCPSLNDFTHGRISSDVTIQVGCKWRLQSLDEASFLYSLSLSDRYIQSVSTRYIFSLESSKPVHLTGRKSYTRHMCSSMWSDQNVKRWRF